MKNIKIELKWAVVHAVVLLLWMLLERLIGLHDEYIDKHAIYTNLFTIPMIIVYVFALLDKRKNFFSGIMTYKQSFTSGLVLTLIIGLLSPLTQIIISKVITPDYFTNVIEYVVLNKVMLREQAELYFSLKNYIIQSVIGAFAMGVLVTAIVSAFVKKRA